MIGWPTPSRAVMPGSAGEPGWSIHTPYMRIRRCVIGVCGLRLNKNEVADVASAGVRWSGQWTGCAGPTTSTHASTADWSLGGAGSHPRASSSAMSSPRPPHPSAGSFPGGPRPSWRSSEDKMLKDFFLFHRFTANSHGICPSHPFWTRLHTYYQFQYTTSIVKTNGLQINYACHQALWTDFLIFLSLGMGIVAYVM
jgi:hypothetical protein